MKKLILCLIFILSASGTIFANDSDTTKISGQPLFLIFSNFHQGISKSAHESNFDVRRAFLGYDFNLNNGFSAFIKIDIGSPDDVSQYSLIKRSAYFKNVGVSYNYKGLQVNFGIIDNQMHKIQEKFWGKRYIYKSYLDEYKFITASDLGINASYKFNDKIKLELGMMNGVYLSNLEGLNKYIYNIGIGYNPIERINLKVFSTYTNKVNDIITSGVFMGIKITSQLNLGAEFNTKYDIQENSTLCMSGYSAYAMYILNKKFNLFARYDKLSSNIPETYLYPWNLSSDGSAIIGGVEYKINENVRISLNYQDWYPLAKNMDNTAYIYFNLEFGLFDSYKRL